MSQGNGKSVMSLIDRLQMGMASVTIPEMVANAEERGPDEKVVVHCDDFLKRLHSYHNHLTAGLLPLQNEAKAIERELIGMLEGLPQGGNIGELVMKLAGFSSPDLVAKATRLQDITKELKPQAAFANWVGSSFWVEVKSRFPETANLSHLALRSDWSIVASEDEDHGREGGLGDMLAEMFGRGGRGPTVLRV